MPAHWLPVEVTAIPPRAADAEAGTRFAERVGDRTNAERYEAATAEILSGNVPDALRTWWPVELDGAGHTVVVWVSPRYLSVGSESDDVLFPLDLLAAARIALAWDCGLPTRRIVDAVYEQATVRTEPLPMPPGPEMASMGYALEEDRAIAAQLGAAADRPGLFAGMKKDLVLTPQLRDHPTHEAIYGWHRSDHTPIQPLSLWHWSTYADYSHGLRLVFGEVLVDGEPRSLWDALGDPIVGPILSDEGPIPDARALLAAARAPPT